MPALRIAVIGCGSRGRTYSQIAGRLGDRFQIIAAADPHPESLDAIDSAAGSPVTRFPDAASLIAADPDINLAIISTQDEKHLEPALAAIDRGWHLLLEKPAATRLDECLRIRDAARHAGRHVILCYVLRHTPFYQAVKNVIDSGRIGRVVSIAATEGVEAWHQAHSFVRGHWSRSADSSPMILAKSCHDTDLLAWFAGQPCRSVSSFGSLAHFHPGNAPDGAPARCTDGCPHAADCMFDAHRYATDKRSWLRMLRADADSMDGKQILAFLTASPWGRCVWRCDNDSVDHQVLALEFETGITATFSMTAFDSGRRLTIHGTKGVLRGGPGLAEGPDGAELWLRDHRSESTEAIPVDSADLSGDQSHAGGDFGLIDSLDQLLATPPSEDWLESHLICFAAESSRLSGGTTVHLNTLR
jgi:predicted dehydrogenase